MCIPALLGLFLSQARHASEYESPRDNRVCWQYSFYLGNCCGCQLVRTTYDQVRVAYMTYRLRYGGVEKYIVDIANNINHDIFEPSIYCFNTAGYLRKSLREG
jgi:hypothetical protein